MTAPMPASNRWLFGPLPDLLLGCGALYGLLFLASAAAGEHVRAVQPAYVLPLLVFLMSTPHYGATIVRVYERREDRHSYIVFSLYATALIVVAFLAGLKHAGLAAWVFTIYITWSPWHYTGQNYGIAVMFLRRRGVAIDGWAKRLLYASFILSYAITFLVLHGSAGSDASVPVAYGSDRAGGVYLVPLGIPRSLVRALLPGVALAYVGALVAAGTLLWRRRTALRDLAPTALLALTQALWFSVPFAFRYYGDGMGLDPLDPAVGRHYGIWIAVGHGAQYLWVTAYYARASEGWHGTFHHYGKSLIAGGAVWFVPALLMAPGAFGRDIAEGGLLTGAGTSWLFLAACINLHHFILDGAIWKLRNTRIASVLIRSGRLPASGERRRGPVRALVWTLAGTTLAAFAFCTWSREVGYRRAFASGYYDRAASIQDRLGFFGEDDATRRLSLALAMSRLGRTDDAIEQLERSLNVRRTARAYSEKGRLHLLRGEWEQALETYEAGLELRPDGWRMFHGSAIAWLALDRPDLAAEFSERALAIRPDYTPTQATLRRARSLLGEAAGSEPERSAIGAPDPDEPGTERP